jgi:hypothetical protein
MRDTGKLPLGEGGKEYTPYIEVAYDGSAWISEGNHRIMAAAALGWKEMPIEIRYFDGGQRNAGPLSPERLTGSPDIRFSRSSAAVVNPAAPSCFPSIAP